MSVFPKWCEWRQLAGAGGMALWLSASGPTLADAIPLAEAERIAVERDAVTQQLGAEGAAMRERAIAAGERADPKIRIGAINVPIDSLSFTDDDMTMLELGVSQEFQPRGVTQLARRGMEQSAAARDALSADRRRVVVREVRRAWVELAYISAARELLRTQTDWVEQMRASARARYTAGEGRQLDILQAGLDAAMLREQQLDLDREEAMRRAQLGRWTGSEVAASAGPFKLSAPGELVPLATLEERLHRHPRQVDFERRIDAARTDTELARLRRKPLWMLDVSYGLRSGEGSAGMSRPDMLSAMVSVDLPLSRANRQDREVNAASADARALAGMHDDHLREMRAMLDEAYVVARKTGDLEQYYAHDLLPLAEQSVQAALLAWQTNRVMFDEVVAARKAALEARLRHARLAADRAQVQYDIDYLAGEDL